MKRILALILSTALVLLVIICAGCGNTPVETTPASTTAGSQATTASTSSTEATSTTTPTETTAATVATTEATTAYVSDPTKDRMPGYEDLNFGGKTFVFATEDESNGDGWFTYKEVYPDTTFTDAVSIAVRQRNKLVEDLYSCKIENRAVADPRGLINADITGQKYTVDFATNEYAGGVFGGNYYNLLNYIDVENPWWDQNYVEAYQVKSNSGTNLLCSIVGDFSLSSYRAAHALTVNKEVYENSGIQYDLAQLVRDGKWTVDIFAEMIKAARKETSGNGKYAYAEGDTLGWVRTAHATHGLHTASGLPMINNTDGEFSFAIADNVDEWSGVVNKAIELWSMEGTETLGYTNVRLAMQEGKTLFASEIIAIVEYMTDVEGLRVGFAPYPKYSESQENYAHYVDNHLAPYVMSVAVTDPELDGKFFEVYAYHSRFIVRPAFISAYSYNYCSDAESEEMLSIILDSRTYDPGYLVFNAFEGQITNMIANGSNNISAFTNRYGKVLTTEVKSYVDSASEKVTQ